LVDVVGEANVRTPPAEFANVGEVHPEYLVTPGNAQETVEVLKVAAEGNWGVLPVGTGKALALGNPPTKGDIWLSMLRMASICQYEPADLTATVQSGCTLGMVNGRFAEHGQVLPLDPVGGASRTIGGIAAIGRTGTLRLGYGQPRDWVLGLQAATPDGKLIRAGGKVVKNVAGYDLTRLFVGSLGTLGVITEVSVKVYPKPATEMTIVCTAAEDASLWQAAELMMSRDVAPVALELVAADALHRAGAANLPRTPCLCVRMAGEEADVRSEVLRVEAIVGEIGGEILAPVQGSDAGTFWQAMSDLPLRYPVTVRVSILPSRLHAFAARASVEICPLVEEMAYSVGIGTGTLALLIDGDLTDAKRDAVLQVLARMRHDCVTSGGALILETAPLDWKARMEVWGGAGTTDALTRGIKFAFDLGNVLNPGRFIVA
jgi:glycolate oxidase FAD binding subunit